MLWVLKPHHLMRMTVEPPSAPEHCSGEGMCVCVHTRVHACDFVSSLIPYQQEQWARGGLLASAGAHGFIMFVLTLNDF